MTIEGVPPKEKHHGLCSSGVDITSFLTKKWAVIGNDKFWSSSFHPLVQGESVWDLTVTSVISPNLRRPRRSMILLDT